MVQKKLNQKKSQKHQEKVLKEKNINQIKKDLNNKDVSKNDANCKDANNNQIELKSDFCKEDHFVCHKFTNDQFNYIRESLIKIKEDKEVIKELDIEHLNEIIDDHHLQTRYMMRQRYDLDKQLELIIKNLKWRKEKKISIMKKHFFPKEAVEMGPVFLYKKTKANEIVCYLRFCLYPHNPIDFMDEFSIYQLNVINKLAIRNNTTWIWFFDFTNATKSNIDIKRFRFMIDIMNTYFPFANTKSIIFNLPWYLSFLKPIFFSFIPANIKKIVGFYDFKNLEELIDKENLPPHLGGPGKLEDCEFYREFMDCEDNPSFEEWAKNPPKELKLLKEDADVDEVSKRARLFYQNQAELIESLKKKGVFV